MADQPPAPNAAAAAPQITDKEKVRIVSDFILHAPPGEFNEVFNDVRELLKNDALLKEGASAAFAQYNKDQLTPVRIDQTELPAVISEFNDLGGGRFYDPRTRQSFRYDHLRKEASDYAPHEPDAAVEPWRAALEAEVTAYTNNHYRHGVSSVFARPAGSSGGGQTAATLTVCIEDHQFQPNNFCNGRWRSQWAITVQTGAGGGTAELKGVLKVQVRCVRCIDLCARKMYNILISSLPCCFIPLLPCLTSGSLLRGRQRAAGLLERVPRNCYRFNGIGDVPGHRSTD